MHENVLDRLAERIGRWAEVLWEPVGDGAGGFRMNNEVAVNLLSSTDLAWILYAIGLEDPGGQWRPAWVRFLRSRQEPATGRFEYEPHAGTRLSSGHAFWHTVRALNILGGDLLHFPHYLRDVAAPAGLEAFFDAVDWSGPKSNHHEVLGLVPLLVNLARDDWTETFYRKLAEQQDPRTGTWPRGGAVDISRTFAYSTLHLATGRMPDRPDAILDAILSLQRDDGLWPGGAGFLTMDSAYLLVRLPAVIGHRQADAVEALLRLRDAMARLVETGLDQVLCSTHRTLGVVQTFSLLQEAFGEAYPSERRWRFDWDRPAFYRSKRIADGLRR